MRERGGGNVGIMGAGWVGLTTAACFAELGHDVVVRDVDESRVTALRAGMVPLVEPGLSDLLDKHRGRIRFTCDPREVFDACSLVLVCVGTPPTYSGDADLSAVWRVVAEIPPETRDCVLVMKSTVPVGTGEKVRAELDRRHLTDVGYVSNPEFLAEATAVRDFLAPSRIVLGSFHSRDADAAQQLYATFDAPILRTDVCSAELIKLASNAFLATKISFINEIANVCEETGADVAVVAEGMGLDERIGGQFLRAGIGYGGSCFPKDVAALKQLAGNSGYHFELLNAVIEVNDLQKRRLVTKLRRHLGPLRGRQVALLGLAFKPGTNDVRESASLVLAARLVAEGVHVRAWDPVASGDAGSFLPSEVVVAPDLPSALRDADAAVVATEWEELLELPLDTVRDLMRFPLVIDGRNFLDGELLRAHGFVYEGVGRAGETPIQPRLHRGERYAPRPERRPVSRSHR